MSPVTERHVVLIAPEIHWNTGNAGRSCLGAGAFLHLIRPLGFSIDTREVKRAGLDYWPNVKLSVWDDFAAFYASMRIAAHEVALFTKTGKHSVWDMPRSQRLFLIFGSETKGIPSPVRNLFGESSTYHIPISPDIRSLNLSTAVGIALYESLRHVPDFHAWPCH
ncbi:MAG: tRNA (cytidine(34)-2'-O)-methyltransferase [Desulfobacteraceae bacterium]|nr:MAG: tRNA (cytidine(34)-2'-O)-methyltransferase [Desulfobacteraceae bacterium]